MASKPKALDEENPNSNSISVIEGSANDVALDHILEKSTSHNQDADDMVEHVYPIGLKIILITISLMLAIFCVALDNTVSWHMASITR